MKPFSQYMSELQEQDKSLIANMTKASFPIQQEILEKYAKIFEYLLRKHPYECVNFLKTFAEKDEFVKSEFENIKTMAISSSDSPEYGLAFLRGNFPKIS
jgi:hypothetical protein